MEKYIKPEMDVELFQAEIITTSAPVSCGAANDELPIINSGDAPDAMGDFG